MQVCKICDIYFEPSSNSKGKFCSRDCYKQSRNKPVTKTCKNCGKNFTIPNTRRKTAKYCSWECSQSISGDKHPRWQGGPQAGWYRRTYGISLEQYDQMYDSQDGECAICETNKPGGISNRFHLDHDHTTGEIRGLLCHKCNNGLGYFNDDTSLLAKALKYLLDISRPF